MARPCKAHTALRAGVGTVAILALSLLLMAPMGSAATPTAGARPASLAPPASTQLLPGNRTEEWEEEEFEEATEGEWEEVAEGTESSASEECPSYQATARVVASSRRGTVRLTVRFATSQAAKVKVDYWLTGAKGTLELKPLKGYVSSYGSIQGIVHLGDRERPRLRAARVFVVHFEMAGAPRYCERYNTRRLAVRTHAGNRTTWSEPPLGTQPVQ